MWTWWVRRSRSAPVRRSEANTLVHSSKGRLLVTMIEPRSYRWLKISNNSSAPLARAERVGSEGSAVAGLPRFRFPASARQTQFAQLRDCLTLTASSNRTSEVGPPKRLCVMYWQDHAFGHAGRQGPTVRSASLLERRGFEPPVSFALLLSESDRE